MNINMEMNNKNRNNMNNNMNNLMKKNNNKINQNRKIIKNKLTKVILIDKALGIICRYNKFRTTLTDTTTTLKNQNQYTNNRMCGNMSNKTKDRRVTMSSCRRNKAKITYRNIKTMRVAVRTIFRKKNLIHMKTIIPVPKVNSSMKMIERVSLICLYIKK